MAKKVAKGRILVVDDEAEICDMLSRHFRFQGFEVETAGNGQEALGVLAEKRVDVVVSDIMMPVMDGIELLRRIRKEYPMIHVIIITGHVNLENLLSAMRHGADTCVYKPLEDLGELEGAVAGAMVRLDNWRRKLVELKHVEGA